MFEKEEKSCYYYDDYYEWSRFQQSAIKQPRLERTHFPDFLYFHSLFFPLNKSKILIAIFFRKLNYNHEKVSDSTIVSYRWAGSRWIKNMSWMGWDGMPLTFVPIAWEKLSFEVDTKSQK